MYSPTVSVIIPVYRGGEAFRRCVGALIDLSPPPDEAFIVEDGASENFPPGSFPSFVKVITLPEHKGPSAARNAGANQATGDILLFLDADVVAPPDLVGRVRDLLHDNPALSAVFGSYDDSPADQAFLSQYRNLAHHFVHQKSRSGATTFWGACGAVRRVDFESVGGFDADRYPFPSIEDVELGQRLSAAGCEIRLEASLQVKHLKKWTFTSIVKTDFLRRALPWTHLIMRDRSIKNDLNTTVSDRFSVALSLILLASGVAIPWWPPSIWIFAACAAALLALNWPLYKFFHRRMGLGFALRTLPFHWLQFASSGIAFAVGAVGHSLGRFNTHSSRDN